MRQTGLTAGNLSSHTSKLEAAGYIEVAGGVCGQKAAYDAPDEIRNMGETLQLKINEERIYREKSTIEKGTRRLSEHDMQSLKSTQKGNK